MNEEQEVKFAELGICQKMREKVPQALQIQVQVHSNLRFLMRVATKAEGAGCSAEVKKLLAKAEEKLKPKEAKKKKKKHKKPKLSDSGL